MNYQIEKAIYRACRMLSSKKESGERESGGAGERGSGRAGERESLSNLKSQIE
jgi:hypothetical protein